jgi:hypothetical protein
VPLDGKRRETIGQKTYALVVVDEQPICDNPIWHVLIAFTSNLVFLLRACADVSYFLSSA